MVRGRGANAEWRQDHEKRGTRVKKVEKEEDKNGSKASTKKGSGKRGFIEVWGNFQGY